MKFFTSVLFLSICASCVTSDNYKLRTPSGLFLPYTSYEGTGQIRPVAGQPIAFILEFKETDKDNVAHLFIRDAKNRAELFSKTLNEGIWTELMVKEAQFDNGARKPPQNPQRPPPPAPALDIPTQALAALFLLREEQVESKWHTFLRIEDKPVEVHIKDGPDTQQIHLSHSDFLISLEIRPAQN